MKRYLGCVVAFAMFISFMLIEDTKAYAEFPPPSNVIATDTDK